MATPTNYSACVRTRTRIEVLNISRDKIFVVNVQPAKTAKFFNRKNFRLYGIISGVRIIRAFNIDDLFHTGRIDPHGMVKIVYIVCTCIHA